MYTPARLYSGLPCPANAGHPVTRGAKKGTEPSRGAGVTGSPAYAGDDSPEDALPAYANVNGVSRGSAGRTRDPMAKEANRGSDAAREQDINESAACSALRGERGRSPAA